MSYIYLQEQGEVSLGESFSDIEPFVQSRLKSTQETFSCKGSETEYSHGFPSGMISEHLTALHGEGLLTLLPEDFPARISALLEKGQVLAESDQDSGRKWLVSLARYDHDLHLWKTAQHSLFGDLETYSETFPSWGMTADGELLELTIPEQGTGENGSGYLPTPTACMYKGSSVAALTRKNGRSRENDRLDHKVLATMRPTPDANMGARGTQPDWEPIRVSGQKAQYAINQAVRDVCGSGQLNPDWVEWLMFWPTGWTSLEPMESCEFPDWNYDPADTGEVPRVGTNIKDRAKRLKAIGNGQVPLVAALAYSLLSHG